MSDELPTLDELHRAWTAAIHAENIPGAAAETRQALQALRDAKHTWVGSQECELRYALDRYLRGDPA